MIKLLEERHRQTRRTISKWIPRSSMSAVAYATGGPILKSGMPRAQGRMYRINKRTSHITICVAERD